MYTRIKVWVWIVIVGLYCIGLTTAAEKPLPVGAMNGSQGRIRISVRWGDGERVARANHLEINTEGWVWFTPAVKQYGNGLGAYVYQLSPERYATILHTVATAAQPWRRNARFEPFHRDKKRWVEITYYDELGWKGESASETYQDATLQSLFDITSIKDPSGLFADMVQEARQKPSALFNAWVELPKKTFRVGEKIPITLAVKNIGTLAAALPMHQTEYYGGAVYAAFIPTTHWDDPREQKDKLFFMLNAKIAIHGGQLVGTEAKRAIRIEPGQTIRLHLPEPLVATQSGMFAIAGEWWIKTSLTYESSHPTTPYAPFDEVLRHTPITITVK